MSAPSATFVRAVTAYRDQVSLVRQRVLTISQQNWSNLDAYRDADADLFLTRTLPVVLGGQRQVASLTDAYLGLVSRELNGTTGPTGVDTASVTGFALRGIDPAEAYRRPFETVWWRLSQGLAIDEAVRLGGQRLEQITLTDLQLARTHTAREAFSKDDRVVGYRRVVTGDNTCDLCDIASTQRYHSDDLLPIHDRCSCDVEPIYGSEDPGQVIDRQMIEDARQAATDRGGVAVRDHGEVGPVLTYADDNFKSADDLGD